MGRMEQYRCMTTLLLLLALAPQAIQTARPGELSFATQSAGLNSPHERREARVLTTQEDWAALWKTMGFGEIKVTEIDFTKGRLLAVFWGKSPAGTYYLVDAVIDGADGPLVKYVEIPPEKPAVDTKASTNPYIILRIPKPAGKAEPKLECVGRRLPVVKEWSGESKIETPEMLCVITQVDWEKFWNRHAGATATAPAVDFEANSVVAVLWGKRVGGQGWTTLLQIVEMGTKVRVDLVSHTPGVRGGAHMICDGTFMVVPKRPAGTTVELRWAGHVMHP